MSAVPAGPPVVDLATYRALFPITERYAYLNHAAVTALFRPSTEALATYWQVQSHEGVYSEAAHWPIIESNRTQLAALMGAHPDEIAWVANTSVAISMVASLVRWREGDNVVTTDEQFPSNVYPWLALRDEGVETRLVPRREARVPIQDLVARMDGRTRLLAVGWVEFNSGFRQDIAALGRICRERGVLLMVDAMQGLGGLAADVHAWGADFVAVATHKWLLGPQGLGVLYIRHALLDELHPRLMGWRSVVNMDDYLNYDQAWLPSARRFEGGTPNLSAHVAFAPVLAMLHDVGPARIEATILDLNARLMDQLEAHGHTLISSRRPGERSGIVCFLPRGGESPVDAVARLQAVRISVAARSGVVRVSPHFYNTAAEIDSLFAPGLLG
ncbi:MAG TPA: aminotransferase class V-fold PLP-dependent enzyme [Chloroflexia bacterium]|nr:aminotransferase class V-fold PLP-dependent enzyme [Chloroflexia bacterium]